jgi:hypothetical protein
VAGSTRIGREGEGLELALRGLHFTRTICTGLSLGVGDTMLRLVNQYLSQRKLYGAPATEIPYVTDILANTYLSLLIADCASIVAMRGLHFYPEEFSIWSNIAKVEVSRLVEFGGNALARALGARFYMRPDNLQGTFQKMLRDGAIVSVFDGSEPVCLDSVAKQLSAMDTAWRRHRTDDWRRLYDLRVRPKDFEPQGMTVFGRGRDAVFASLPALRLQLDRLTPSPGCSAERLAALRELAAGLHKGIGELFESVRYVRQEGGRQPAPPGKSTPASLVRLAERCCDLHAAVTCLGLWLFNRDYLDETFASGEWLECALARASLHQFETGQLTPSAASHLIHRMEVQQAAGLFFSVLPIRQAEPGSAQACRSPSRPSAVRIRG